MDGTNPTYPAHNTIVGNHFDTVGVYMKQTSCYFKAITYANTISNNICHDGPRAGVNFNDGFMGGDLLEENVIWFVINICALFSLFFFCRFWVTFAPL